MVWQFGYRKGLASCLAKRGVRYLFRQSIPRKCLWPRPFGRGAENGPNASHSVFQREPCSRGGYNGKGPQLDSKYEHLSKGGLGTAHVTSPIGRSCILDGHSAILYYVPEWQCPYIRLPAD